MHLSIQVLVSNKKSKDKKADEKPPAKPNDPEIRGVQKTKSKRSRALTGVEDEEEKL